MPEDYQQPQPVPGAPVQPVSFPEPQAVVPSSPPSAPMAPLAQPGSGEAAQQDVTAAPSAADNDKVWISKEEYERLRQAQNMQNSQVFSSSSQPQKLFGSVQTVTAVTAAIGVLLGLIGGGTASFFLVPSLIILVLLGAFTLNDYAKAKAGTYAAPHKGRNTTLLVLALVVLASPVLMIVFFVLLISLSCAGGACRGS